MSFCVHCLFFQCVYTYLHHQLFRLIRILLRSKRVIFLSGNSESIQLILPL